MPAWSMRRGAAEDQERGHGLAVGVMGLEDRQGLLGDAEHVGGAPLH